MKGFHIRISVGQRIQRFDFATNNYESAEIDFDKAVKELNSIYKTTGKFSTEEEVIDHFLKYGFYKYKM